MNLNQRKNIGGLILSAGFSFRMKIFKPLLPINGSTFLSTITFKLKRYCDQVVIVTGYKHELIAEEIEKCFADKENVVLSFNPDFEKGMFTSLKSGVDKLVDKEWILYHFVDQPGLPEKFYADFISQLDEKHNWIQPVYNGKKGHPILFKNELFQLILNSYSDTNLKELSFNSIVRKKYWNCSYPEILQDIDTPEDLKEINHELI